MLVVVAIEAEQLPVAAVARVVVVVVVLVMNGQFAQVVAGELAAAATADPGVELERLLPVTGFPRLAVTDGVSNHLIKAGGGRPVGGHWQGPFKKHCG